MITIFTTPKDFNNEFEIIQKNAINSWRALSKEVEIIIFGDSNGAREISLDVKAVHIPDVKCSPNGVPILSDLFNQANQIASNELLMFINADIILPDNFLDVISILKKKRQFLMVGHRWDMDIDYYVNFNNENKKK